MAKDNVENTVKEFKKRNKIHKRIKFFAFALLILLLVVIGIVYYRKLKSRNYEEYDVINTVADGSDNIVGYLPYGNRVVRYSMEGAVAIGKDGDLYWNGAYEMKDPIADVCEDYVAVADRGNKSIHIYNSKGDAGSINTLYNIVKIQVARQGVVAVLMEEDDKHYITLFSKEGKELVDTKVTDISSEGYPLDLALSNDGKKLVVSYIAVNKGKLESKIAFFNYDVVGKNYTDRFVGGDTKEVVIPRTAFLDNDTVCLFKEDGLILYSMKEIPEIIKEIPIETSIKSILYNDKYAGIVTMSNEKSSERLIIFDLKGEQVLDTKLDYDYDGIHISNDEIILYNTLSCKILKINGDVKFQYDFSSNISGFYSVNNLDKYFIVSPEEISLIQLISND